MVGFLGPVQTDIFGKNGFKVYSFNSVLKKWDISSSTGQYLFQANQAYYVYSSVDKYIDKIAATSTDPVAPVKSGWNFIWVDSNKYLGDISLTVYGSQNQCSVKYVPLRFLKNDDIVYKWIYNVVDGQALDACHAFSLLTGKDLPSTSCSAANPLLNETSYAKSKTGLWIYLWPGKVETWAQRNAYLCN